MKVLIDRINRIYRIKTNRDSLRSRKLKVLIDRINRIKPEGAGCSLRSR